MTGSATSACAAALFLVIGCNPERMTVGIEESIVAEDGGVTRLGFSCQQLSQGQRMATGTGGGGSAPRYTLDVVAHEDSVELNARSDSDRLSRTYTREALATGTKETLDLKLGGSTRARFDVQGGEPCNPPKD
ncbi:hypothetical protein BH11MYX4_BH11MYX4_56700 [soil metagenome]